MKENSECCCHPDWEAECKRLTDELGILKSDYKFVKLLHDEVSRELDRAKAKLEMVYLIFGERR